MANLRLLQCLLYKNRCYLSGQTITPTKIVLHSTGANNDTLRRYVQPHSSQTTGMEEYQPVRKSYTRQQMLALLGTSRSATDWQRGLLRSRLIPPRTLTKIRLVPTLSEPTAACISEPEPGPARPAWRSWPTVPGSPAMVTTPAIGYSWFRLPVKLALPIRIT